MDDYSRSVLDKVKAAQECVWINPDRESMEQARGKLELSMADIDDAEQRLQRFAPFLAKKFPETAPRGGLIESELVEIPRMKERINEKYNSRLKGRLLLKKDSHLAIAGSVKARGGIYEVLKHTEDLAFADGILKPGDSYAKLADEESRRHFQQYTVQVGSTGNLGMSIGIMSAAIGYHAIVHMSADAREWKKRLLREHGVTVLEYPSDYSEAVKRGREQSDRDPKSYFVDDENSRDLFLGYSVAAKRLVRQLGDLHVTVDEDHPLLVYIPCGVGGAPGGITFGLRQVFGDAVHCFFVEPTQAPCMLAGMVTGKNHDISVQDLGLSGRTDADGLAVGRPSGFVGGVMKPLMSGDFTVADPHLYDYMRDLLDTEKIFLEPSACASFQGPAALHRLAEDYLEKYHLEEKAERAVHIAWATGGSLVPEEEREKYRKMYL